MGVLVREMMDLYKCGDFEITWVCSLFDFGVIYQFKAKKNIIMEDKGIFDILETSSFDF